MKCVPSMTNPRLTQTRLLIARCLFLFFFLFNPPHCQTFSRSQRQHGFIQNISLSSSSADNQKPMSLHPLTHPAVFQLDELKILYRAIKTAPLHASNSSNLGEIVIIRRSEARHDPKMSGVVLSAPGNSVFPFEKKSPVSLPSDSVQLVQNSRNGKVSSIP